MLKGKNILLGITGGIAAYKTLSLIRDLKKQHAQVKVILTPDAKSFVTPLTVSTLSGNPVFSSFFNSSAGEWSNHVELAAWADLFVIAPATANTLAKMANGICDNLLLATYLSAKSKVMIAPAMDLDMYQHPTTSKNLKLLTDMGHIVIDATEGELASGLVGKGRMEEPEKIMDAIQLHFDATALLKGKKVLITGGPTYEQIDPVRFIGNHSSGKMGAALAERASELGAEVTLIMGPSSCITSEKIMRKDVLSAEEMYQNVHEDLDKYDIIIMSAAVADYTPKITATEKIKKKDASMSIDLQPTKDILKSVGALKKPNQLLVGFALETSDEETHAKQKLKRKNLDLIVLNSLRDDKAGFGYATNKVTLIDKHNKMEHYQLKSKSEVAVDIFNKIISLLG